MKVNYLSAESIKTQAILFKVNFHKNARDLQRCSKRNTYICICSPWKTSCNHLYCACFLTHTQIASHAVVHSRQTEQIKWNKNKGNRETQEVKRTIQRIYTGAPRKCGIVIEAMIEASRTKCRLPNIISFKNNFRSTELCVLSLRGWKYKRAASDHYYRSIARAPIRKEEKKRESLFAIAADRGDFVS